MSPLAPCPSCARHVRIADAACPFCGGALDDAFRETSARAAAARTAPARSIGPGRRLGRAALFAFGGAALAGTSGCYEHHLRDGEIPDPPIPVIDAGVDSGGIGLLYGAPPEPEPRIDAGPEMPDAALIAAYGGPIPVPVPSADAGASPDADVGGPANLYGAAPAPDE
jgi:hypothetical protein